MKAPRRATPSAPDSAPAVELGAPDWSGPTKSEVAAQSRRAAQAQRAAALAAYRQAHPDYRGSDAKMEALMQIEAIGRGNADALTGTLTGQERSAANGRSRGA